MKKIILKSAKRVLSLLLVLLTVVPMTVSLVVPASAAEIVKYAVEGGYIYFDPSTGEITGCDPDVTLAHIPSKIKGVSVTSVGDRAFENCFFLSSIVIPYGVTSIGEGAFRACVSLAMIAIPDSVTSIGKCAFQDCNSLTSVTLSDRITNISDYTFYMCFSLTKITIPHSVTSIGDHAFHYCTSLETVTIPDSVTNIGDEAFHRCTSLTSIIIGDSVADIGEYVFSTCTSLTTITIPDSVTSIGYNVFAGCDALESIDVNDNNTSYSDIDGVLFDKNKTELISCPGGKCGSYTVPDGVMSIGDYAFCYCYSLTAIDIPDSVISIEDGAFNGCDSLTSIAIPDNVTSISVGAFANCTSLTFITLPDSITSVGDRAFYDCFKLKTVYYCGDDDSWNSISIANDNEYLKKATRTHNYDNWITIVEPTCTDKGSEIRYCSNCDAAQTQDISTVASNHTWGDWNVLIPATCTIPSYETRLCTSCRISEYRYFSVSENHTYSEWIIAKVPTSIIEGEEKRVCLECGFIETRSVPAMGNSGSMFRDVSVNDPYFEAVIDCYNAGLIGGYDDGNFYPELNLTRADLVSIFYQIAKQRGEDVSVDIENPFKDVSADDWYYDAAMWAYANGVVSETTFSTFSPDQSITKEMLALVIHSYINEVLDIDIPDSDNPAPVFADNDEINDWAFDGVETLRLKGLICGDAENKFYPNRDATRVDIVEIIARIIPYISLHTPAEPLAPMHKHVYPVATSLAPTCTENGHIVYSCSCGDSYTKTITATGNHTWNEWSIVIPATCITEGKEVRLCVNCDAAESKTIPATGMHAYGEWTVTTEPTCTEEGIETKYCVNCDASETQVIPANGHSYGEWAVSIDPTCVAGGAELRACANCDATETKQISATGIHIYGEWIVTIDPTMLVNGEQTRKCENCDATEIEEIEKLEMTNPFTDVKDGQWYTEGILWCYHSGYMAGVSDTVFGRKDNVTRAMFATILAKIDGSDISGYSEMSFTDVKPGQWYSNAIEWAASNGYAAGLGEGIFGYKQNVSREQIALFFYTYSSKNGIDVSAEANLSGYADLNRIHSWALDAVEWAVAEGLISGTSDTTLSPRDSATRAEIALVIKNYVENVMN